MPQFYCLLALDENTGPGCPEGTQLVTPLSWREKIASHALIPCDPPPGHMEDTQGRSTLLEAADDSGEAMAECLRNVGLEPYEGANQWRSVHGRSVHTQLHTTAMTSDLSRESGGTSKQQKPLTSDQEGSAIPS